MLNKLITNKYMTRTLKEVIEIDAHLEGLQKKFGPETLTFQEIQEELVETRRVLGVFATAKAENEDLIEEGKKPRYHITEKTTAAQLIEIAMGQSWTEIVEQHRPKTMIDRSKNVVKATKEQTMAFGERTVDLLFDGIFHSAVWLAKKTNRKKR